MTPASEAVISVNCLSEATSASFWNSVTESPSLIYNFLMVPYLIFSPRSGKLNFKMPKANLMLYMVELATGFKRFFNIRFCNNNIYDMN